MNEQESLLQLTEQLRESEARYRHFIEQTADSIWCLEPAHPIPQDAHPRECARVLLEESTFTEGNGKFTRRYGVPTAEGLRPADLNGFWLSGQPSRVMTLAQSRFRDQEVVVKEVDNQGRVRHLACALYGIEDDRGLKAVWAIERDVTTKVEEEQLLRQSQEFYKAISETALDGICVLDDDLSLIDCNDAFAELAQESRESLLESGVIDLQPVLGIKDDPVAFASIAKHGRWRGEAVLTQKPGAAVTPGNGEGPGTIRVELACRVTEVDQGQRYYCFLRDLSERRSAEKRENDHQQALAHVARLSTLGEMTSGIAHELNQPLAAIVNYANGCARILDSQGIEDPMITKGLSAIAEQGRRAADIIRRMRSFSRRESDKREPFRISDVLSEAIELSISDIHKAGIHIDTDFAPTQDVVVVDGIQIEQVTLNLIRNAIEALTASKVAATPGDASESAHGSALADPRIVVSTSVTGPAGAGEPSAQGTGLPVDPGQSSYPAQITVTIEDNGPGIPDTVSAQLFDPFFTRGGQGIGLGLTISRSIVESHGGRLWYAPGQDGASFHFTLPLRTAPIQA